MLSVEVVKHWFAQREYLKQVQKQERGERNVIISSLKKDTKPGTLHATVGSIELTLSQGEDISIVKEDLLSIQGALTDEEKECVTWVPKINKRLYDTLPEDSILRSFTTVKPKSPQLKAVDIEAS